MNTTSAFPAEPGAQPPHQHVGPSPNAEPAATGAEAPAARGSVLVWDAPVRVVHWLMVLSFAGAWLTAETERWRLVHVSLGYTLAGLVLFRVLWGLVGTRYARFGSFVRGPGAVMAYLRSLLGPRPQHHTGHNPAGGWAILGLLGLGAVLTASGWALYNELGGDWLEELHEALANGMLALVVLHVLGVLVSSGLHRENLVRAMFTGRKPAADGQAAGSGRGPASGIGRSWASLAGLVLAAVLGFWAWQWLQAPTGGGLGSAQTQGAQPEHAGPAAAAKGKRHDDDD